jgi:hypothetical protein
MKNRITQLRALILALQNKTRLPGTAASEVRGKVASVTVRRDGGVAITVYLLPIDRPATYDLQPGTYVTLSK